MGHQLHKAEKGQPPVVLLTLGAGAKAMLLGSIAKPLPCKPSGNLTGPMGRLSWMGFGLEVLRVTLTALTKRSTRD